MRGMIRRAMLVAGPAAMLLGLAAGVASASGMTIALSWSPSGTVTYSTSGSKTFTLTNKGTSGSSALTVTLAPTSPAFTKSHDTCTGVSLGAKKSCTVTVTYAGSQAAQTALKATGILPGVTASVALIGTIPKASPTLTTTPGPGGTAGSAVLNDSATLSGGASPGGTITFNLYDPSNPTCSGTPAYTSGALTVTGDGTYTTTNTGTAGTAGNWNWTVTYSGDNNNNGATSTCGQQTVAVTAGFTTSPSPGATLGSPGLALTDTATLTGWSPSPTGTITFNLYGPNDTNCANSPVYTVSVPVNGNGQVSTQGALPPNQGSYAPTAAGTYDWTATYTDSSNITQAYSGCGQETVTIDKATPTLTSHADPVTNNVLTDNAMLMNGVSPGGTITFNLYGPNDQTCQNTPVFTTTVNVSNGNGSYDTTQAQPPNQTSYTATAGNTYEWTATYSGDGNNSKVSTQCGQDQVNT